MGVAEIALSKGFTRVINSTDNVPQMSNLPTKRFNPESFTIPELDELIRFCKGHSVLIHCRAGRHRAATTAACILTRQGRSAKSAVDQIHRYRHNAHIDKKLYSIVKWVEDMQHV